MKTEEFKKKIEENSFIYDLRYFFSKTDYTPSKSFSLIGGAVIDIIDGRIPKDYDFIGINNGIPRILTKEGFEFFSETGTAITYKREKITVQFLKTKEENFDFKISQSKYKLLTKSLVIDETSFLNRTLIPTRFDNKELAINALRRIPHWENKGFTIASNTYQSLITIGLESKKTEHKLES